MLCGISNPQAQTKGTERRLVFAAPQEIVQFAIADVQTGFCARANGTVRFQLRLDAAGSRVVDGGDCSWNLPENPALLDLLCREVNSKLRLS